MAYGAQPSDWDHLVLVLGLQEHLLPVVSNPQAPISANSALKRLGQIPSVYNHENKVVGFAKWTERFSSLDEIERWKKQPDYGICIITREVRAFDCDITNSDLSCAVYEWLLENLPVMLPLRGRSNASKFLLAFKMEGEFPKRILKLKNGNEGDKIEFLASGQQFIAVGTHPSGVRYEWRGGLPTDIPVLSKEQFETLWKGLEENFGAEPSSIESFSQRAAPGGEIDDDKLDFLEKAGVVLGYSAEGSAYVTCPFKSGHSKESDKTETIYFPKGLRGYTAGHWKCLHASCSGKTDDDFFEALNFTASLFDELPPEVEDTVEISPGRFTFTDIHEFSSRKPQDYHIKNIMPKADLVVLFGESGSGKSFVALDMAFAIARGSVWNGHKTKQGRVAYVVAEGAGGFQKRAQAYANHFNVDLKNTPISVLADQPNLLDIKDSGALCAAISGLGPVGVVFIDTFAQTTPGANENSAEDIGKALAHCRTISKKTGVTVVLIHHAGKDLTKGARGWSGLRAAADAEIEISRSDKYRSMRISKQKDGEDGAEWGLVLREVALGVDEDEAIITSCIVEYTAKNKDLGGGKKKIWPMQKLVNDTLEKLGGGYIAAGMVFDGMKAGLPVPEGRDTRGQRVRRAVEGMIDAGLLEMKDGLIGIPMVSE